MEVGRTRPTAGELVPAFSEVVRPNGTGQEEGEGGEQTVPATVTA